MDKPTMTPQEIGNLLSLAETATRAWIRANDLLRISGTTAKRPKYRREDVMRAIAARVPHRDDVTEEHWPRIEAARFYLAALTMHFPKGEPEGSDSDGGDNGGKNE